jgi:D-alanyl-lipoteichoic acid acyltransferase DltB (MBOAT superfamily)
MYKQKSEPVKSMLDFSLFVTFFPHLVAGPIVRPPQLVPQFETERKATQKQLLEGLFLITLGLFMKVVLADSMLSATANDVFGAQGLLSSLDAWMGVLAFSGQIFFDFAGYSTCAIGVAACLGFVLPQNFLYPYAAIGFSDFWRRWHITLSAWLRDYLYIPLGGNRNGKVRTYINLMITMLLGGLWHGANWTFVVWGGLHGFYLWVEKAIADFRHDKVAAIAATPSGEVGVLGPVPETFKPKTARNLLIALFTFFLINVTWVFFRSATFTQAWGLLKSMFGFVPKGDVMLTTLAIIKVSVIVFVMLIAHWLMRNTKTLDVVPKLSWWFFGGIWAIMLLLIIWSQESSSSFIYFQF